MSLKEKLQHDLTEAIRARDELRSGTIRMLLTAITTEEVAGKSSRILSDDEIITVLSREVKKRREAAEAFDSGGAKERADRERSESEVIADYLPEQLSESELAELVSEAIRETGASGPSGMGQVMKYLQPKISGRAEGGVVSAVVKKALTGN